MTKASPRRIEESWSTTFLIVIGTSLAMTATMTSLFSDVLGAFSPQEPPRAGQIAQMTEWAPRDFLLEDQASTEYRRAEAGSHVKRVFRKFSSGTDALADMQQSLKGLSEVQDPKLVQESKEAFERQYRLNLEGNEWGVILDESRWGELQRIVNELIQPILQRGVIATKRQLVEALGSGGAVLRDRDGEQVIVNKKRLLDLEEAHDLFLSLIPPEGFGRGRAFDTLVRKLEPIVVRPNVRYDPAETEKEIRRVRSQVKPIYYRIKRGEVIVRAGEVITSDQENKLEQLARSLSTKQLIRVWVGYIVLSLLVIMTVYLFTAEIFPQSRLSNRDLFVISLTLFGSFVLIRVFSLIGEALGAVFYQLNPSTIMLMAPVAAGGVILQVTMGAAPVFAFLTPFTLLTAVFLEESWLYLLLILLGNVVGAVSVKQSQRRSVFWVAGFRVATVNAILILCQALLSSGAQDGEALTGLLYQLLAGIFGGLFSGVLAYALTPITEFLGAYVSDIKLLELGSLDRPLLKDLSLQAPGTWNHSMVMGQMGEVAALSIGANGLLTRVGAYYHDIGKMKKPDYFIENRTSKENKHDKLTPSMSALIIKAHVKDGLELAKKHRLPGALQQFIQQHHGTSLIEFFYEKARKESGGDVDQEAYRYPGPKPQTKESAILMLADAVEAASRTLADPTPAKVQGCVQKIINKIFRSGQLDESPLTLRDLHSVAKSFTTVLTGIYHRRIEYREPAEKGREGETESESNRSRSEGGAKDGSKESTSKRESSSGNEDSLKRLGI